MESLPPPNTKRWVVRRKAAVVAAVRSGGITIEEACRAYQLSEEELLSWERAFEIHGLAGLRATRVQQYRRPRRARVRLGVAEPASLTRVSYDRILPPQFSPIILRWVRLLAGSRHLGGFTYETATNYRPAPTEDFAAGQLPAP